MPSSAVELARAYFEAVDARLAEHWAHPDADPEEELREFFAVFERFLTEDAVWQPPGLMDAGQGREGLLGAVESFLDAATEWRVEIEDLTAAGEDRVLGTFMISVRGKDSGAAVSQRVHSAITIRDGRIASIRDFVSREEALEALSG